MYERLNDLFSSWTTSGIFSFLEDYAVPWQGQGIEQSLDISYHGGRSGKKIISPLLESLADEDDSGGISISDTNCGLIAKMIFDLYGINWGKLYTTLSLSYNIINNYDLTETETTKTAGTASGSSTESTSQSGQNNITTSGTQTGADTGTDSMTHSGADTTAKTSGNTRTVSNTDSVYGFNSTSATSSAGQSGTTTDSGTEETTYTAGTTDTETRNMANSLTRSETVTGSDSSAGSKDGTTSSSTSGSVSRELTRSGNIGVTTSQQMIQAERDLWQWYFFDIVFQDLDRVLTLSIY